MQNTKEILIEHFDEDVHDRLNMNLVDARERLDKIGRIFWEITKFELNKHADFSDDNYTFVLKKPPERDFKTGIYHLISKSSENISGDFLYRLNHPLGSFVLSTASRHECKYGEIAFDITNHPAKVSVIEAMKGKSGWLRLSNLKINSFESQDYLLFSAFDCDGASIDHETCEKLFSIGGIVTGDNVLIDDKATEKLNFENERFTQATLSKNLEENSRHFNEARDQLDKWADDMEKAAQKELDNIKRQIRDLQRQSRQAPTLNEQKELQDEILKLERNKRKMREKIFDMEDEIADKRDHLIDSLEKRMKQKSEIETLFTIKWKII